MIKKSDNPPRRFIEVEVEVPGTPEQVWQAIATGPGFSAWFVPTDIEEREGGAITFRMGPGMESAGVVTRWDPPRVFVGEEKDWLPGAPPVATEIHVEARSGGTCVVRLVNSLFTSSGDWDDQLESFEKGWPAFLNVLRLYLTRFPGQRCSGVQVTGFATGPEDRAWDTLRRELGLADAVEGRSVRTAGGAPALAGVVERTGERRLILLVREPAPGVALLAADAWAGRVHVNLALYFYGDAVGAVAAREEPARRAWMEARFPSAPAASEPSATTA